MKKYTPAFYALLISLFFIGCKKGGDDSPPVMASISTTAVTAITHTNAMGGGSITSPGTGPILDMGLVWHTAPNPNMSHIVASAGNMNNTFSHLLPGLQPGTTYYVRAYVTNNAGTAYGNEVSFSTPALPVVSVNTVLAGEITTKAALLKGTSIEPAGTIVGSRGFCYSTTTNPNVVNSPTVFAPAGGAGDYSLPITNLQHNTTYYVRAFAIPSGGGATVYGSQLSFKTTGYLGTSGGYVFYDKGETTDGWRYMEAAPLEINYDITFSTGSLWGCNNTNILQTLNEIGTGLSNTSRITAGCGNANCAARLCANYSVNSISGWFLPSRDEAMTMILGLYSIGQLSNVSDYWTSTEINSTTARNIYYDMTSSSFLIGSGFKTSYCKVRPVRRF
jgi:hypothetical protein